MIAPVENIFRFYKIYKARETITLGRKKNGDVNFPTFKEYMNTWHGAEDVQAIRPSGLPWSPQRFCMELAVQCLDVSLESRQLVGHAWGFRANLNFEKLSREMQTLLTSESLHQGLRNL